MTLTAAQRRTIRELEFTITRRLDGLLHGDHHGLVPGHGFESGEARPYVAGDDVRRMDWNVTARTGDPHVRAPIADRELETTIVLDLSGSMDFGTTTMLKRDLAIGVTAAAAVLAGGAGNRVGALLQHGGRRQIIPARSGAGHVHSIIAAAMATERDGGAGNLASVLREADRINRRRGLVVIASDFMDGHDWIGPLRVLASRHDALAVEVVDPREMALPDVGFAVMTDPETGRGRNVDTRSPALRRAYQAAALHQRSAIAAAITRSGARHVRLDTGRDWVADLASNLDKARRERSPRRGRR